MTREVAILGAGTTPFGELWERSFRELITLAGLEAVKESNIEGQEIGAMYVGSMSAGRLIGQEHAGAMAVDEAGLAGLHLPAVRVEAGDASGAVALRQGVLAVASGVHDVVVVGGVEKMTDVLEDETTRVLVSAADREWEGFFGATLPALYAMMARRHMHEYGTTREQLAAVSVKNHAHGAKNDRAAYPFTLTLDKVLDSPPVAEPLHVLDCAAPCDGAAAVVLAPLELARELVDDPVVVAASEQASDTLALHARASLTGIASTRAAADRAYARARVRPADIQVAEVHDSYTIAEILSIEDLGFFPKGEGGSAAPKGLTTYGGRVVVNPGGGLKARGHALGATGLAQAAEVVAQLRGTAGARQVADAEVGLAHALGGTGGTAVVHVLRRAGGGR